MIAGRVSHEARTRALEVGEGGVSGRFAREFPILISELARRIEAVLSCVGSTFDVDALSRQGSSLRMLWPSRMSTSTQVRRVAVH